MHQAAKLNAFTPTTAHYYFSRIFLPAYPSSLKNTVLMYKKNNFFFQESDLTIFCLKLPDWYDSEYSQNYHFRYIVVPKKRKDDEITLIKKAPLDAATKNKKIHHRNVKDSRRKLNVVITTRPLFNFAEYIQIELLITFKKRS